MKIETTRFGTITAEEEKVITMPFGMLGFPDAKRFIMLQHKENSPFFWYQSVDDPTLAFVIMNPFLFEPDYNIDLDDWVTEMAWNEEGRQDNLELYVVVNIPKGAPDKMTANLIGPILINNTIHQAVQMIISESSYSHKFPLLQKNSN